MSSKVIAGRYELLEKIGDGGMAVVYKAKCRLLNRFVALKILKPEFTKDAKFIESFRKESHAAASLSHTNIVNIYDVGKEGNINYIVMELIDGKPLSEIIKEEAPLEYRRVIDFAKQIASGLSAAHKQGIIHRDIKPHNILVNKDGIAKIADFGIAKAVSSSTIVDGTGESVMGSVHYFSPEQARGGYVDEKTDIYSLGIVMYEMLTGKVPFDGDNPVSVALMHINEDITPPSKLVEGIPPSLEKIVMKATDKYQTNRFNSTDEMVKELDNIEFVTRVVGKSAFIGKTPVEKEKNKDQIDEYNRIIEEEDEKKEKSPSDKKKRRRRIIIILGIILLLGIGIAIAFSMLNRGEVEVPNVKGRTYDQAKEILERENLKIAEDEKVYNEEYGKDRVISQDPNAGDTVKEGTTVYVRISKGSEDAEKVTVPNVIGETESNAKTRIRDEKLEVEVKEVESDREKGIVVSQDPSGGSRIQEGSTITISVSKGKGTGKIPDIKGMTESQARQAITQAGFQVGNISRESSDTYREGTVMAQQYPAGDELEKGSSIGFTISQGNSSSVDLYIDYSSAKEDVFYMTVTVSDQNGTRNIISSAQRKKSNNGETVQIKGTGQGSVTVIFDNKTVYRYKVDFGTGRLSET